MNQRVIVTAYGEADVLRLMDEPLQAPASGEVLIRVEAAGVALGDVMRRKGVYPGGPKPPFTPGYDGVGRIEAVGEGVSGLRAGERVAFCLDGTGAYSRYVRVREQDAIPVPASIDPYEAVCLVLNYVTAYQLLHRAVKKEGMRRILVHGAAGGVGTALLELGRVLGLTMIGTASEPKLASVRGYGAMGIDYRSEDFVQAVLERYPDGVDAVFDPIGGDNWRRSAQTLRPGGALVGFGFTSVLTAGPDAEAASRLRGDWSRLSQGQWHSEKPVLASAYSVTQWKREHPSWFRLDLQALLQLLSEGRIKPVVHAVIPLQEAAEAHRLIESSRTIGKIIVDCL
ncbi:medium chain dehydrogenase/reductase family protein [Paenibacillus validus]|uniref:medium chain dehydrogenase/reductase family protein n=1 Tax=Paenibacillus validus TaxID=44253 RepID=UPI003D2CA843